MGVFRDGGGRQHSRGMHWPNDQYTAYHPSRGLSPKLPTCEPQIKGEPPGDIQGSIITTGVRDNNNHTEKMYQSCDSDTCNMQTGHNFSRSSSLSQPAQSVISLELKRPGSSFDHHIPKIEPDTASTPPLRCADENGIAMCAGCGIKIKDRFYLQAVERRWHVQCLQCCQCRNQLDGDITCYSRDDKIYCKRDYYRLFGMKRCARCQATILSSELVMRARDSVFHVQCFSCEVCSSPLTKGDQFGMKGCSVLCREHFESSTNISATEIFSIHNLSRKTDVYIPPFPSPEFLSSLPGQVNAPSKEPAIGKSIYFSGQAGTPRQKGRPRKRKPKDLEGMAASLDLNQEYLDIPFGRSPGTPGLHGSNQRTKRMRTSFKHHQLRTMKSYFAINHNPDAKDLKQLSQKTGLPKRVLQVWFQNARAKWRRMMLKQEGKSGEKCSGSESMSDIDMYSGPGGPASIGSSIGMPPQSPPFLLPNTAGSPSNLDCP